MREIQCVVPVGFRELVIYPHLTTNSYVKAHWRSQWMCGQCTIYVLQIFQILRFVKSKRQAKHHLVYKFPEVTTYGKIKVYRSLRSHCGDTLSVNCVPISIHHASVHSSEGHGSTWKSPSMVHTVLFTLKFTKKRPFLRRLKKAFALP